MKKNFKIESFTIMTSFCLVAMANTAKATESCQYVDEADGSISYCCEEATCPADSYATEDECLQASSVNALRGCRQVNDCWKINPCEYSSQENCERYAGSSSHTLTNAFACTAAEDGCYYPSSCKSPYVNVQPAICEYYTGDDPKFETLVTKRATYADGIQRECYKKEAISCANLRYHGTLMGYDGEGYPTWAGASQAADFTKTYKPTIRGDNCAQRICYDNDDHITITDGTYVNCFKSGASNVRGNYKFCSSSCAGYTNVEGYTCCTNSNYCTTLVGGGYFVDSQ